MKYQIYTANPNMIQWALTTGEQLFGWEEIITKNKKTLFKCTLFPNE